MAPRGTVTNQNSQTERLDLWGLLNAPTPTLYNGALPAELAGKATTAYVITDDSTASTGHGISQGPIITPTIGKFYIASAYFHAVAGAGWAARFDNNSASGRYVNLATGAVGSGGGGTGFFQASDAGGGWYRLSYLYQCTQAANSFYSRIYLAAGDGAAVYTGTGGANQIAVCGVMHEEAVPGQLTPSPYVASGASAGVGPRDFGENFIKRSESVSASPWSVTELTPTAGQPDPNGGTAAVTFLETANTNAHVNQQNTGIVLAAGASHTFATVVKDAGRRYVVLRVGTSVGFECTFDLTLGSVTNQSSAVGKIIAIGSGYYLAWITFTANATTTAATVQVAGSVAGGAYASYAGDVTKGFTQYRSWLAQANQLPDYRKNTSGICVPSGAPRLMVL